MGHQLRIHFSFENGWPVVSNNKWNPMEYWNRSGSTTTQASTVQTSEKPTTASPTSAGPTSGEPLLVYLIVSVYHCRYILFYILIVCHIILMYDLTRLLCFMQKRTFENIRTEFTIL